LKLLERAGEISNLELQPKFPITVNGVKVCTYIGDFRYTDRRKIGPQGQAGCVVLEDIKSPVSAKIPLYRLKRKLVHALYPGVKITEVY